MAANGLVSSHDKETDFPFRLQDSCLITIINRLDSYPVDWLALLPLQTRHRLLTNLPILDLCRLDHTTVAEGIDIDDIWKSLQPTRTRKEKCILSTTTLFMTRPDHPSFIGNADEIVDLEPELLIASPKDKESKGNRETYLLQVASEALYEVQCVRTDLHIINILTSMRGDLQETITAVLPPNTRPGYSRYTSKLLWNLTVVGNLGTLVLIPSFQGEFCTTCT